MNIRQRSRQIYTHEKELLNVLQKLVRQADIQIQRMKQLTYTKEGINDIWSKMYKEVCRKWFEQFRIEKKMSEEGFLKAIKSEEYNKFWTELHIKNTNLYNRASLYFNK